MAQTPQSELREDVEFRSHGALLRGWLYPPRSETLRGAQGHPMVVMAHGLSMTRDGGLEPFAEAFAAAGCRVLVFDYRCFGDSEGEPRELVSVDRQLQDYRAAIAYARGLEGVDPERIALWGTSYSGGHVIELAGKDRRIAAVISQVPNLDSLATLRSLLRNESPRRLLWLAAAIVRDALRGLLRRAPLYLRSIAPDGDHAAYVSAEGWEQVEQFRGPNFRNRFAPRGFLRVPPYRPIRRMREIACRVLLIAAERDNLTPSSAVRRAAELAGPNAELISYPIGHFGAYVEPTLSDSLVHQVEFFARELAPPTA
jgi:pimeloyl-ACP methyl ester carboxylesterase